jgi:hypothetical protein
MTLQSATGFSCWFKTLPYTWYTPGVTDIAEELSMAANKNSDSMNVKTTA